MRPKECLFNFNLTEITHNIEKIKICFDLPGVVASRDIGSWNAVSFIVFYLSCGVRGHCLRYSFFL